LIKKDNLFYWDCQKRKISLKTDFVVKLGASAGRQCRNIGVIHRDVGTFVEREGNVEALREYS